MYNYSWCQAGTEVMHCARRMIFDIPQDNHTHTHNHNHNLEMTWKTIGGCALVHDKPTGPYHKLKASQGCHKPLLACQCPSAPCCPHTMTTHALDTLRGH
jgi:hypothetical protein